MYVPKMTLVLFYTFIYFFSLLLLAVLSLSCCTGFSLVVANGGCSLVAVCGLLIVVTSLVGKQRL